MSKRMPPVPLPRNKISSSPPQSPIKLPQQSPKCSTPPPVAPKPSVVKRGFHVEIIGIKRFPLPQVSPPLPAPEEELDDEDETLDVKSMSDCFENRPSWTDICRELKFQGSLEAEIIKTKARHVYEAMQVYIYRMTEHGESLKQLIDELYCIADSLDKASKGTKIAGITGGAATVAGGIAAAAGVILSPFTLGASLALTAVGVGAAAAGGVTGASAAIANKATVAQGKKKIDKILQDFSSQYDDILTCLRFISEGMEQLKLHGVSGLDKSRTRSKRAAKVVELVMGEASGLTFEMSTKASGMITGFAIGMDFYFTKGKNGHKVKKGLESKLAQKIRTLAEDLEKGLNELVKIKELFSEP